MTRWSRRLSGTSPSTMRSARPSTMAVLPTPGSPMSTGLFLVRRLSTWMTRRISSSRPITGSSLPARARAVRSRPKRSRAWYFSSAFGILGSLRASDVLEHLKDGLAGHTVALEEVPSQPLVAARPMSTCSVET